MKAKRGHEKAKNRASNSHPACLASTVIGITSIIVSLGIIAIVWSLLFAFFTAQ
jgi:uncharacterized membrane protein YkgB